VRCTIFCARQHVIGFDRVYIEGSRSSRRVSDHVFHGVVEVPSVALAVEGGAGGVAPGWRITFQVEVEPMF
jgi:hypothetical protein